MNVLEFVHFEKLFKIIKKEVFEKTKLIKNESEAVLNEKDIGTFSK